mmetsp:Transcript_23229/g.50991  ORF Transcript_23229/g.50991 Transcript_23229/m.50991 type:complete len:241 (+) Transcript_23229:487-1209(+)
MPLCSLTVLMMQSRPWKQPTAGSSAGAPSLWSTHRTRTPLQPATRTGEVGAGASAGAPHAGADLQAMTVAEGLGAAARSGAGPQIGVVAPAPPAAAGRQTGVAVRAPPVAAGLQAGAVAPARPVEADPLAAHTPDERRQKMVQRSNKCPQLPALLRAAVLGYPGVVLVGIGGGMHHSCIHPPAQFHLSRACISSFTGLPLYWICMCIKLCPVRKYCITNLLHIILSCTLLPFMWLMLPSL